MYLKRGLSENFTVLLGWQVHGGKRAVWLQGLLLWREIEITRDSTSGFTERVSPAAAGRKLYWAVLVRFMERILDTEVWYAHKK